MIRIPVTKDFNQEKIIGYIELDEKELPKEPNFVFSIGYKEIEVEFDKKGVRQIKDVELKEVSLILDDLYKKYLELKEQNG